MTSPKDYYLLSRGICADAVEDLLITSPILLLVIPRYNRGKGEDLMCCAKGAKLSALFISKNSIVHLVARRYAD